MSSSSSPAHLQPRDCPGFVSKPSIDTAPLPALRTEEEVAGQFAYGGPAAAYRREWICFEAAFKAKGGIVFLNQVIGKEVDKCVLQGWKGVAKGEKRQRMTDLRSHGGLLVGGVPIFLAGPDECFGEKAKYVAFGERPLECVYLQMNERLKRENGTGSVDNGNEIEMRPLPLRPSTSPSLLLSNKAATTKPSWRTRRWRGRRLA